MDTIFQQFSFIQQSPIEYVVASAILIGIVCAYSGSPLWIWAILGYTLMLGYNAPILANK